MADKSVGELIAAQSVTPTDLFVLEQNGTAKKLTGRVLENWLVSFADGHGGIQSIEKLSTNVLADTYRITLADTTTFDFVVTNGRGITGISKNGTSGLVDTYTISYNNGTTSNFTVTNGEKGDNGDNAYVWIKYASRKPTESSHSMGDIPDDWIGIYSGNASTAPTDWKQYQWFKHKGEQGDTGNPATLVTKSVTYQVGDSGTIIPSGSWGSSIPVVSHGKYLWTKTEVQFNTGDPIVSYSVARMGIDGTGAVSSVAGVSPDATGNVTLTAADVGALAVSGGDMEGAINMNGQPISGLNDPTEGTQAARKGYVDAVVRAAAPRNLLDNSDFRNPVNQRGSTIFQAPNIEYWLDRWVAYGTGSSFTLEEGKVVISSDGTATCGLMQRVSVNSLKAGSKYTLAFKAKVIGAKCYLSYGVNNKDNTASSAALEENVEKIHTFTFTLPEADADSACYNFRIRSSAAEAIMEIEWAALYEGEYTAETLPEYQPKGHAAELMECYRYFYKLTNKTTSGLLTANGTELRFGVETPIAMRTTPTLSSFEMSGLRTIVNTNIAPAVTDPLVGTVNGNVLALRGTVDLSEYIDSATNINNTPVAAYIGFELSADL